MKRDIVSRPDVDLLVREFYEMVQADELLAPFFSHVDWHKHLPVMQSFWASLLLGEQSYRGNPFGPHVGLSLQPVHFRQWLAVFTTVVDKNFRGEKADEIKARAHAIAGVFQHKLHLNIG